jgi:tRNA G10  N-methylase Trm11
MRIVADALALPLASASVDAVISNPPYPTSSDWGEDWWVSLGAVVDECRRVLKKSGRGWFLVRNPQGGEQWMTFNRAFCRWAHPGRAVWDEYRPGIVNWGVVPDAAVVPLIKRWSPPGGVVLDPFAGRGGVLRLAARLGRVPVGADIDLAQLQSGGPYALQERQAAQVHACEAS